ncbi:Clavaminate synthase-like protein [Cadophora sp. DSE1049]|nr:Clavaminate synthase-like protein [Cadophora sp. DSE1049]
MTSVQNITASTLKNNNSQTLALTFESFDLPATNQRVLGAPHPPNTVTPLALRPSTHDNAEPSLSTTINTIKALQAQDGILTNLLARHGTLLFRDLPIHSATDFSEFAHAFGYKPHEIIGIVVDRPMLAPNVAPANEAPKEVLIYNHNESPQVPHAPEYIFFHSHKAPSIGGETPISSSLELFERARAEIPEFIEKLGEKGILSKVTYKVDKQYEGGSTLKQAFGKEIQDGDDETTRRTKIEAQIRRYGRGDHTKWEWSDDGTLVLTHHLPAIRTQPNTNLPTLFTGLAAYYRNLQTNANAARGKVTQQLFGDGTPIPEKYLKKLAEITEDIRVLHKWHRGDVLVYDNVISQHGRQPWGGQQEDRVVLASLFDGGKVPGRWGNQEWAQVVQAHEG